MMRVACASTQTDARKGAERPGAMARAGRVRRLTPTGLGVACSSPRTAGSEIIAATRIAHGYIPIIESTRAHRPRGWARAAQRTPASDRGRSPIRLLWNQHTRLLVQAHAGRGLTPTGLGVACSSPRTAGSEIIAATRIAHGYIPIIESTRAHRPRGWARAAQRTPASDRGRSPIRLLWNQHTRLLVHWRGWILRLGRARRRVARKSLFSAHC
mmetsp:Transcript_7521/g.17760  ORF Transcript_7521/g.17760 Transcript_7521/m.17760 type:complete len:213 (+) Transcript_7521:66-704(+)